MQREDPPATPARNLQNKELPKALPNLPVTKKFDSPTNEKVSPLRKPNTDTNRKLDETHGKAVTWGNDQIHPINNTASPKWYQKNPLHWFQTNKPTTFKQVADSNKQVMHSSPEYQRQQPFNPDWTITSPIERPKTPIRNTANYRQNDFNTSPGVSPNNTFYSPPTSPNTLNDSDTFHTPHQERDELADQLDKIKFNDGNTPKKKIQKPLGRLFSSPATPAPKGLFQMQSPKPSAPIESPEYTPTTYAGAAARSPVSQSPAPSPVKTPMPSTPRTPQGVTPQSRFSSGRGRAIGQTEARPRPQTPFSLRGRGGTWVRPKRTVIRPKYLDDYV